jgi:hypothetical protein
MNFLALNYLSQPLEVDRSSSRSLNVEGVEGLKCFAHLREKRNIGLRSDSLVLRE